MSRSTTAKRFTRRAVVPAAILVGSLLVWDASQAAFSGTTSNDGNGWETGTVTLTDDDAGSALFTADELRPGSTGENCIEVTSTGSLPAAVTLYGEDLTQTNALATHIALTIEEGTGGEFGDCTGFSGSEVFDGTVAGFAGASTDYSTGVGSWTPAGTPPESQTYKFTYTVSASTPDSAAGSEAGVTFTWESQNS